MHEAQVKTEQDGRPAAEPIAEEKPKKTKKSKGAGGLLASMSKPAKEDSSTKPEETEKKAVTEEEVTHTVTFDLKEDEFATKGKEAAELQSQISKLNYEFAGVKRTHKAETELREEKIAQLLGTIRRGKEDREVKCKKVYDFESGIVRFFFENKLVDERPMEPSERQMRAAI